MKGHESKQTTNGRYLPQRVVSLQPSATVTLRDLGALDRLVACTKYCIDFVPEAAAQKPQVVQDSWSAKAEEILRARPDLVLASVPYQMESLGEILKAGVPVLALAPHSLEDIYFDIAAIARALGAESAGQRAIGRMQDELASLAGKTAGLQRPRVFCEEWGKPLIASQRWVAELVEAAGGEFVGEAGKQCSAENVREADPDVVIAAWCGAGERVPLEKIVHSRGWENMKVARHRRVYCIRDEFLNTPASTLLLGARALAHAIHPEVFSAPAGIRQMQADPVTQKA